MPATRRAYASRLTETREMQLFLIGYIIISICEIFTVGGFPLDSAVRKVCPGLSLICYPLTCVRVSLLPTSPQLLQLLGYSCSMDS